MKIAVDASWACGQRVGTGNFTLDLLEAITSFDQKNEYLLYFRSCCPEGNPLFRLDRPNVKKAIADSRFTLLRVLFGLSREMREDPPDVFLSPAFFLPLFGAKRYVVTFHDMNIYVNPRAWARRGTLRDFILMRLLFPLCARRADRIVSISNATRNDLVATFPFTARKTSVVYHGLNLSRMDARSPDPHPEFRSGQGSPYFLFVGTLSPIKNLERTLRAFAEFRQNDARGFRFVIAGNDRGEFGARVLHPLVQELEIEEEVRFIGYSSEERLAALYLDAYCLIFPSLREGFGYPILEAMHWGCPVITSNLSSCPEVGGDAALYVDPLSQDEIRQAMSSVVNDGKLREALVVKGKKRQQAFSFESMAKSYVKILEEVAAFQGEA